MFENMEAKEWLALNAKLQKKKNAVRKALKERGIQKKDRTNDYDHYKYFSEAQYKLLFTELFSENDLELKFTELEYGTFEGTEKQANGRMPKLRFALVDVETGFFEETDITGEGIDKGDKAGYKAYTGALKYYLANTFMVATGDDPEMDSPEGKMNNKVQRATQFQVDKLSQNKEMLLDKFKELNVKTINDIKALSIETASELLSVLEERIRNAD